MTHFVKLLVRDREGSARFYEALGFERVGADGTFVHLRYPDGGDLFAVSMPPRFQLEGKRGFGVLFCFKTTRALEVLAGEAVRLGAKVEGPEDQPWNTRELVVTDPDGYRLNFIAPLPAAAERPAT